jgi:hypothetical protein
MCIDRALPIARLRQMSSAILLYRGKSEAKRRNFDWFDLLLVLSQQRRKQWPGMSILVPLT